MTTFKATLALSALLLVSSGAYALSPLVGSWKSVTAENGALDGEISMQSNNKMVLAPKGQPVFNGTWASAGPGKLTFSVPEAGVSEMQYALKGKTLTLTYDNGNKQNFIKKGSKSSAAKATKP